MSEALQQNIAKAEGYLARFKDNTLGHYINGEWTQGQKARPSKTRRRPITLHWGMW
ncbi:hypothetical protein [Aliamphritea spongicola]|nr:hypothetical protein [Aliamphritea spongicola]